VELSYESGFSVNNNGIEFVHSSDSEKKIIIPYKTDLTDLESRFTALEDKTNGLFIENNGTEFVDHSDSEKKIIIPCGKIIPKSFFSNSDTYLPTISKYLFTYSNPGSPISTLFSLFNFFSD
jgi:hypothetical protein